MERGGMKMAITTKARKNTSTVIFHFPLVSASAQTMSVTAGDSQGLLAGMLLMVFPQDFFLNLASLFHSRTPLQIVTFHLEEGQPFFEPFIEAQIVGADNSKSLPLSHPLYFCSHHTRPPPAQEQKLILWHNPCTLIPVLQSWRSDNSLNWEIRGSGVMEALLLWYL